MRHEKRQNISILTPKSFTKVIHRYILLSFIIFEFLQTSKHYTFLKFYELKIFNFLKDRFEKTLEQSNLKKFCLII